MESNALCSAYSFSSLWLLLLLPTLQVLGCRVCLGAEVGRGGAGLAEEAAEKWLKQGVEDDLGTASLGKGHPQDEDELERVVKWEPVDGIDGALKDGEEGKADPVGQPLSVIGGSGAEQCLDTIVSWNDETSRVDEEFSGNVEEDEEEVDSTETENDVDLGNRGLLFEVVESSILGQLLVQLADLVVCTLLERHCCGGSCVLVADKVYIGGLKVNEEI